MVITSEWDSIALLRASGFTIERLETDPATGRVRFVFAGEQSEADQILQAHELGRLRLPTLNLLEAFRWAKIQTHKFRDSSGKPRIQPGEIEINGNRK